MGRILWFHPRPLLPPQGGGDLRTLGLAREVAAAGHEILMVVAGVAATPVVDDFEVVSVPVRQGLSNAASKVASRHPLRSPRVSEVERRRAARRITEFDAQVSIVSEVMAWSLAARLLPAVPWVYDAANVEHDLFAKLAGEATGLVDRLTLAIDARRVAATERLLVQRADAVAVVSVEDAAGIAELDPRCEPRVVPSSVPTPGRAAHPATAQSVALFVGTLDYLPNMAAVRELIEQILPTVRRDMPDTRLVVAGRRPTRELRQLLSSQAWIEFHEDLPDLSVLYERARCVVLPIRFGGGSRLKVYEALAHGQVLIGTASALAGVPVPEDAAIRAETPSELAAALRRVLSDEALAAELGRKARAHFVSRLAPARAVRPLLELIDELT